MSLSHLSYVLAAMFLFLGGMGQLRPDVLRVWLDRFPRSAWPGRLLTAIGLPWAAYFQLVTPPVAGNDLLVKIVMGLVPVAFILIMIFLKELLSVRALGGILLLAAAPLLKEARLHDSSFSVAITLITYVFIVIGIIWVLSPFRFRHWVQPLIDSQDSLQKAVLVSSALGLAYLGLGAFIY